MLTLTFSRQHAAYWIVFAVLHYELKTPASALPSARCVCPSRRGGMLTLTFSRHPAAILDWSAGSRWRPKMFNTRRSIRLQREAAQGGLQRTGRLAAALDDRQGTLIRGLARKPHTHEWADRNATHS
jgi:hypothetical protein